MEPERSILTILLTLLCLGALVALGGALHSMSFVTVLLIFLAFPFVALILAPVFQTVLLLVFAMHSPTGRRVVATLVLGGLLMAFGAAALCLIVPFESLPHAA